MTAKYYALLTRQGAAKLANATALGTTLNLTQMAVGDGNGVLPTPDAVQTKLINQKRIAPLNMLSVDPENSSQIIAEQVIPENEGGYWIREIGLFDDDGVLIAVANCPETYKPLMQEGSGRTQTVRMVLVVSDTAAVTLKIDPAVVLATRKYVDDSAIEFKAYADNLLKTHVASANPHKQYLQINQNLKEIADAGSVAVAGAIKNLGLQETVNLASDALQKTQNGADIPNKDLFVQNTGSARAYSAWVLIGGDSGEWTTAEFIAWLEKQGAFQHPYWVCKGSWAYAHNKIITDTGCGKICLAGAVVEVFGLRDAMTIRITTPTTTVNGGIPSAQFTYINHGDAYAPGWRRDFNTINKPTSAEMGAVPANGGSVQWLNDAKYYLSKAGYWQGAGAFAAQYTDGTAPFFTPKNYVTPKGVSQYLPICKGSSQTQEHGYGSTVSFGILRTGAADFGTGVIHIIGDNGSNAVFQFGVGGDFNSPGAVLPQNYWNFDQRYQSRNTAGLGVNGWHKDTSTGLITQWGRVTSPGAAYIDVAFPIAFPSICASISCTVDRTGAGAGDANLSSVRSVTRTGFQAGIDHQGSYWIAMGY